jgi:hypothetical protein
MGGAPVVPYIRRDADGNISGLVETADQPDAEPASISDPEVMAFLFGDERARGIPEGCNLHAPQCLEVIFGLQETRKLFFESDLAMARVVEDLIDLLIAKGVLRFTDLPEPAQKKLLARSEARTDIDSHSPLVGGEDVL